MRTDFINSVIMKIFLYLILIACNTIKKEEYNSVELISSEQKQAELFQSLMAVASNNSFSFPENDSLAFLILPLQASCPSCRKKTIDSIMAYITRIPKNHYIIVASNTGRRTTSGYFKEQEYNLPPLTKYFQLDSVNHSYMLDLYKDKPTFYYTTNKKTFKKVSSRPSTIRDDLREFFSGYRKDN